MTPLVLGLDYSVHQIDFVDKDLLAVTLTGLNSVVFYKLDETGKKFSMSQTWYPAGELPSGLSLSSENYRHINSIYYRDGCHYLVYHNQSFKTGRKSELAVFDNDLKNLEIQQLDAECAHNILCQDERQLLCDSWGKRLLSNDEVVFSADRYLRGLAANEQFVVVGGSQVSLHDKRGSRNLTGKIYLLDKSNFQLIDVIKIPSFGNIYEIRFASGMDAGLSSLGVFG